MDKKKARGYGGVEPFSRIRKELVKEVRGQPRPRMPAPVRARQRRDALPGAGHAKCVGEASRGARGQRERACVGWQPRERGHVPQSQAGRSPVQLRARVPAQVRALAPSDRVLVLGCSAEPHAAVKKDAAALLALFDKHILVPLPDYAARRARHAGRLAEIPRVIDRQHPPPHARTAWCFAHVRARAPPPAPAAAPVAPQYIILPAEHVLPG